MRQAAAVASVRLVDMERRLPLPRWQRLPMAIDPAACSAAFHPAASNAKRGRKETQRCLRLFGRSELLD